jgi:hypothetical protein
MIISASRRTDIPAFYTDWFIERIKEGFFYRVNPFNINQVKGFSLDPKDVDAIVLWSKNPEPMIKHLDYIDSMGFNYYFQFTLNDYPEIFEPYLPSVVSRIETFMTIKTMTAAFVLIDVNFIGSPYKKISCGGDSRWL